MTHPPAVSIVAQLSQSTASLIIVPRLSICSMASTRQDREVCRILSCRGRIPVPLKEITNLMRFFIAPRKMEEGAGRRFGVFLYLFKMDLDPLPPLTMAWEVLVLRSSKCLIIQSGGDPFCLLFKTS